MFGYSFATWRLHLRAKQSAAQPTSAASRPDRPPDDADDVRTVAAHTTVGRFRLVFPLGSTAQAVVVDEHRRYIGIAIVAEVHSSNWTHRFRSKTSCATPMSHYCRT
jgi:CIC family chloride channel protein